MFKRIVIAALAGLVVTGVSALPGTSVAAGAARSAASAASWPSAGHDANDSRSNPDEHVLGAANVGGLQQRWSRTFSGTVAATPAVVDGAVYVGDAGGTLWALDASDGATHWSKSVSSYTGIAGDYTRATPAVANGRLVFGTRVAGKDGIRVVAARTQDGAKLWSTVVDPSPLAKMTGAPTVVNGVVYIGVSSTQEDSSSCCSWRGSVVALNATTGRLLWRTMMVPVGYTGGAVWSSNPAVDVRDGLVYFTTGNNYSVPAGVCTSPGQTGCAPTAPTDYADSILALRVADGTVAWTLQTLSSDVSSSMCQDVTTCGPDFDFGSGANLFTATIKGVSRKLVGAGQKSGIYWTVDAVTGKQVWSTRVGPGGGLGGVMWGTANDGQHIYAAETDFPRLPYQLVPSGRQISYGSFAALNPATGALVWQTADPAKAFDFGFVSTANGVVYGGSSAVSGPNMYALSANNGKVLWSFASGGSVMGGAAIVGATVFWVSGYYTKTCPGAKANCRTTNVLHAFALPR